ncbi:ABC transporter ATP-binding protein [Candidatus Atribacteria bacterium RBG_19FT_COMBO_35_14]|uniref:ABC transporter ATP-binding protein n=1 Tax=Candidatus Sediminicultor quintus TaxID=1797291 RepID=A0A1F5A5L9_9BACT|nr:MAG: ABC transporter ATP-binding protein [Candidatus Atribacteria bacterium RBG_19FT_COMBO_35_14]
MISLENISIGFQEKVLFDNLNWKIPRGSHIGLVGNNGTGKTTLFRTIVGFVQPDKGNITLPRNQRIGYLPQDLIELKSNIDLISYLKEKSGITKLEHSLKACEEQLTSLSAESNKYQTALKKYEKITSLFEHRGGYTFSTQAHKVLKGLGFREKDFTRQCTEFSGGWKMRIILVSILLSSPDIILLDEPTNHLDTESLEWLESWLLNFSGTIIVISHDRYFMDKLMTQIAELAHQRLTIYQGNFSYYLKEKEKRHELLQKEAKNQQEKIAKTETFIERFRYKNTKAVQVQSRIKMLEKMQIVKIDKAPKKAAIYFPKCPRSGDQVVNVEDLTKKYEEIVVFSGLNFTLHRSERVALVGVNGAGKSTLSRLISERESPTAGTVHLGHKVNLAFFSQESSDNLNYNHSVWEEISAESSPMTSGERRNLLGAFLFSGDAVHKPISVLSGGEKSRLALAKILMQESNFLILDEPTNHLDIITKELFQRALLKYSGTILIVSHDRFFLDNLITRVIEICDGRIYNYPGNYSYFIEKRAQLLAEIDNRALTIKNASSSKPKVKTLDKLKKREEAEKRNRIYRQNKDILDKLKSVETEIKLLEKNKVGTENQLCDPLVLKDSKKVQTLMIDLKKYNQELKTLTKIHEALTLETKPPLPSEGEG